MSALGRRLRELRGKSTQLELSEIMGISAASISSWENGVAVPPELRIDEYAERFYETGLSEELHRLREQALLDSGGGSTTSSMLIVLQDIRYILTEIRERLDRGQS
jgi:transcriptional regulator with XRE-family HTH domain